MSTQFIIAKGFRTAAAIVRNTNAWGGKATAVGAGHGLQVDKHTLVPKAGRIDNDAVTGAISRQPGRKGNELTSGEIGPCPLYYRGVELPLALAFGTAGTPTTLTSGAYLHKLRLANDDRGLFATFVTDEFGEGDAPIWEFPHVKITGFKIECEQGKMAKITFPSTAFTCNFNRGTPDPVTIVSSVEPANGARTIASQPGKARKVHVRITDANVSITEYVLTFVGTNSAGETITEVYTLSTDTLLWTSDASFKTITSITGSALAGTATGDTLEIFTAPVVRRATPANTTYTLDAQPGDPSQLRIQITDANSGITEFVLTMTGTDPDGNTFTETYTHSTQGGPGTVDYTTLGYFKTVISIVGSALAGVATAGTDYVQIDCKNGINNRTSIASVTEPSERDFVVWAEIESVLVNLQSGGALTAATATNDMDEVYPSKLSVDMALNGTYEDVTTRYRSKIDEPVRAGSGFATTKVSLDWSKTDTRNHRVFEGRNSLTQYKMKITFKGPQIASTGYYFQFEVYLNGVQFDDGAPSLDGPGVLPLPLSGMASQVLAVPTGFPTSLLQPIGIDLQTSLATDPLA